MKKLFFTHNYAIILFYVLGLLHWLFFFFFADYYSYHNIEPTSKIEIHQNDLDGINILPILKVEGDFKGDRVFFKSIISEKKINFFQLFQYIKFERDDWPRENRYQDVIAKSLKNFQLPFYIPNMIKYGFPDKFLGSVHYTLSPQIILLYFFSSEAFSILNLFLMFTFGFIGCLLIKNYFKLNSLSFFLLFIIFNFNGYWVEKFSTIGPSLLGYYCLPYIFYFLIRLSEIKHTNTQRKYYWSILIGLFLSLILLQGSLHFYVEMITFFVFWSLFNLKLWKASFLIYLTTFSTIFFRLFPAMLTYGVEPNAHALLEEGWGGYNLNMEVFISAFVSTKRYFDCPGCSHAFSLYISLPGFLLLVYFGLWVSLINDSWRKFHQWKSFIIPCILITVISFDRFKFYIVPNFIPLLNAESLTTRYMIIPLIFISIIAAINFQGFIENFFSILKIKFISYFLIITSALFLFNHSRVWRHSLRDNELEWATIFYPEIKLGMDSLTSVDLLVSNDFSNYLFIYGWYFSLFLSIISIIIFIKLLFKFRKNQSNINLNDNFVKNNQK